METLFLNYGQIMLQIVNILVEQDPRICIMFKTQLNVGKYFFNYSTPKWDIILLYILEMMFHLMLKTSSF